jgi:hypothetical protein
MRQQGGGSRAAEAAEDSQVEAKIFRECFAVMKYIQENEYHYKKKLSVGSLKTFIARHILRGRPVSSCEHSTRLFSPERR